MLVAEFLYIEKEIYSDMCQEIVKLRATNDSLESNMLKARSAYRGVRVIADRMRCQKDAVISQLKQDVAESEEALMQWKGKCFVSNCFIFDGEV